MIKYHKVSIGPIGNIIKEVNTQKSASMKTVIEIFENIVPYQEFFQDDMKLTAINIDREKRQIFLKYSNSVFLANTDELIYHVYVLCGYLEAFYEDLLGRKYIFNIKNIQTSPNIEDSYVEILIDIK
jgi:hypothetical protein